MGRALLAVGVVLLTGGVGCAPPTGGAERSVSPAPSATSEATFGPPAPPPPEGPLRVLVAGDLLPHRPSLVAPDAIREALAPLKTLFENADAVVANYEAATGEVDKRTARLVYAAPPGWLEQLPAAGLKAVTVANNHACDLGAPGLEATLAAAARADLTAIGADDHDPWAPRVLVERSGKRVCAVGWTTLMNSEGGCAKSSHLAVAPLGHAGKARIDRAMARARAHCDATIAIFHGGIEYVPQTSEVLDMAGHAAEAGADAVVIHHPHIASPVVVHETRDGRKVPIFASVGNLVTNQGESWRPPMFPVLRENRRLVCVNGWTRLGVLADLSFRFDGAGGPDGRARPRLDWGLHLTWVDNEHTENRSALVPRITARLLDAAADQAIIARLSDDPAGPTALFSDPCWLDRGGDDPRCHTDLARTPAPSVPAPAAVLASRARKKR